jgi:hypothetical protein
MLYEVSGPGGCIIEGPNPHGLHVRLAMRLQPIRIEDREHAYDRGTFLYNVASVGEDIRDGHIAEPADEKGWEDAIVREFRENLAVSGLEYTCGI